MARSDGIVDSPAKMSLENIPDRQRLDGDMFFALVGVHRRLAAHRRVQFLNVEGRRVDDCPVGPADPYVHNIESLKAGSIRIDKEAELVNGGFRLDAHAKIEIVLALAV